MADYPEQKQGTTVSPLDYTPRRGQVSTKPVERGDATTDPDELVDDSTIDEG